jgi:hypothetical protein
MKNRPLPDAPVVKAADSKEALLFVQHLQEEFHRERPLNRETFIKQYLDRFTLGQLESIGRRILMDLMKRPQVAEAEPASEVPAPRRERARRGGDRRNPTRAP